MDSSRRLADRCDAVVLVIRTGPAMLAMAALVCASPLRAQEKRGVEFALQPGVRTVDAFTDNQGVGSASGFDIRLLTTIPTSWHRVDLVVGATFAPFGLSKGGRISNEPSLFYGVSLPITDERHTDGWLALTLPVLGVYQFDVTGAGSDRLYEHDLDLELSVTLHAGRKLLADLGPFWSRLDVFAVADQSLTPNRDAVTRGRDFFNPTFTYGVSIPIAGYRK